MRAEWAKTRVAVDGSELRPQKTMLRGDVLQECARKENQGLEEWMWRGRLLERTRVRQAAMLGWFKEMGGVTTVQSQRRRIEQNSPLRHRNTLDRLPHREIYHRLAHLASGSRVVGIAVLAARGGRERCC